jgi:hypothetical protein
MERRSVVASLAIALTISAAAVPADAQPRPIEHFAGSFALRAGADQPVASRVRVYGAFADQGTLHFRDDRHGVHHDIYRLTRGTIDLAGQTKTDDFSFNPTTCVGRDRESGTYALAGTGQYAGLSGQGTWRHHAVLVAPLTPGCTPDSPGTVGFVTFTASGPVTGTP